MTETQRLAEIAKWCDLWLAGETDRKWTAELISGIAKLARGEAVAALPKR